MQVTTLSELTMDGRLTLGPGRSSKELFDYSSKELKEWFHEQRAASDAIMVGAGTVRADNPQLTVRYSRGKSPLRIIVSASGVLPANSHVLTDNRPTLVVTSQQAEATAVAAFAAHPAVGVVGCGMNSVDLPALMALLVQRGLGKVVVEGGATLLRSLFAANLVSRVIVKHIPVITAAPLAPSFIGPTQATEGHLPRVPLTLWRLDECFRKGDVAVCIYSNPALQQPRTG